MLRPLISGALTTKAKPLALCCFLLVLAVAAAGAGLWLDARPASAPPLPAPQPAQENTPKALLLTVRPTGFEPAEMTVQADSYLVVIQNRSGLRGVTLRLDEESRGRLMEMSLKARLDWRRRLNLAPGRYSLTAANDPEWVCHITVTP